jgi:hypothetical protein
MTAWRRPRSPRPEYRVRLECGHAQWVRTSPMTKLVKYGCNAGQGCGYQLSWTAWWHIDNPDDKEYNGAQGSEGEQGE